jgi:transcription-repair coupling factor (superfamily II helicase)
MAHGQMKEHELEKAMHDFLHKKVDVLLATTIIESGLDIPSVNTLVVEEAEEMGLAQLYQLRGRVGRSKARAYCYLFHSNIGLTTDAKKRLEALKEFTSLGSGFRLAMRDMEIRGAGNLLGPQQHGNIAAVGIETYGKLLTEEISRLKGEPVDDLPEGPVLELNVSAFLPGDYVPSESERVLMYKRILSSSAENLSKIKEELVDRCGPLPVPAEALFESARMRLKAKAVGISEIHEEEEALLVYFRKGLKLRETSINKMLGQPPSVLAFIPGDPTGVRVFKLEAENGLKTLQRFLALVFE